MQSESPRSIEDAARLFLFWSWTEGRAYAVWEGILGGLSALGTITDPHNYNYVHSR